MLKAQQPHHFIVLQGTGQRADEMSLKRNRFLLNYKEKKNKKEEGDPAATLASNMVEATTKRNKRQKGDDGNRASFYRLGLVSFAKFCHKPLLDKKKNGVNQMS